MSTVVGRRGFLAGVLSLAAGHALAAPTGKEPRPRLGINLSGPADWSTELPFVDVFRLSRRWISQRQGVAWGKGPDLALDERGWVTRLEADCWAETPLCTIEGGHYPAGRYTILCEGQGRIEMAQAARVVSTGPGRIEAEVDPKRGSIWLRLRETKPDDPVRNIRVVMPGFEKTYREQPFHPKFLDRWQGMACLRFMDWMHTNGSKIARWDDRPKPEDATFTPKGIALETMIALANRLKSDPWFCVPHRADDDYVRRFAQQVREQLDPSLKVYVEYSNEVWNGSFEQHRYAGEQGRQLGLADKAWEAAWRYTARRSVEIFKIWEQVFGGAERLVRVLPSQAANPSVSESVVGFEKAHEHADVLAIAPYVSCNVPLQGKGLTASVVEKWSVDEALDHLEKKALPQAIEWIRAQKKIADRHGLNLVAYEAGQHMVGVQGGENNEAMTKLFHAANAHPRMGEVYRRYYAAWTEAGGDLLCHFSSVSDWSKWGSWGALRYYDDDQAASPKFVATMRWARQCGQPVRVPE